MSELNVVLAGGGTAGHIEPALAVGEVLRDQFGANVVALGTERGLETTIVPARGFQLALIDPVPIPRKKPWKLAAVRSRCGCRFSCWKPTRLRAWRTSLGSSSAAWA